MIPQAESYTEPQIMAFLFTRTNRSKRPTGPKKSFHPRLEVLEDRTVLSTLTVLNNLDSGPGSLRDTIHDAMSGDMIIFDPSLNGQTITLTSGELEINNELDIEGPGASLLAISGNDSSRVFNIRQGGSATIAGLTITQGRVTPNGAANDNSGGAGIRNEGTLTLRHDVLSHNQTLGSDQNSWSVGGAVLNYRGNFTATDTAFVGNLVVGLEGALGGAIASTDQSTGGFVARCTFIDNEARGADGIVGSSSNADVGLSHGGAICNTEDSEMTVVDSTFTDNRVIGGNGIEALGGS